MRHQFLLVTAAVALIASSAAGQDTIVRVRLDSGTLLRMTPQTGQPFEGRLLRAVPVAGSVLYTCRYPGPPCSDPSDSAAIRRTQAGSLLRLEVQRGNHAGSGALIGGGIGLVLGLAGASWARGLCESQACVSGADAAPFSVGAVGALIGALFGWASPRWGRP